MSKDEQRDLILDKLSKMPPSELDRMRDITQLELKGILHKYHIERDRELTVRFEKREKFLSEGDSFNKAEQRLRADKELYLLKKTILALSSQLKETELKLKIVENYYWKNKGG